MHNRKWVPFYLHQHGWTNVMYSPMFVYTTSSKVLKEFQWYFMAKYITGQEKMDKILEQILELISILYIEKI